MRHYICLFLFITLFLFSNNSSAQDRLYMAPRVAKAIEKGTRSEDGNIGKNYWANHPSYFFNIDFDPTSFLLKGNGSIDYINNSPDTLSQITIALLGNIYKEHIVRDWSINLASTHEGTIVEKVKIDNIDIPVNSDKIRVSGTNLYISLDTPILPKSTTKIELNWHVLFPPGAVIRSGNFGDSTFFISYFYPKIAVYDDIDGWDNTNYTGYTEFYGEYSDFEINITLPGDFFVWSTGELQNPKEVYTKKIFKKFKQAKTSDKVISIINEDEAGTSKVYSSLKPQTWKIKASNVTDFAFGCSNKFLWDSRSVIVDKASGRRTVINAAYRKKSEDYREVAQFAAEAIHNYSTDIPGVPYPYPVMTIFNGVSGMEFPMMCNNASQNDRVSTVGLAYHEIAHTYFPFFIGVNERKYAWMDEGWATFFTAFYFDKYDFSFKEYFKRRKGVYEAFAGDEGEAPMIMTSRTIRGRSSYRQASYNKSFLAYYYLMDYLGKEKFLKSLQGYMNRWNGKHPIPQDYFNSINNISSENLNWFWKSWFIEKNHADLAIGDLNDTSVEILNIGQLFLPIKLTLTYKNGDTKVIERDISIWKKNPYKCIVPIENAKDLKSIKLGDWNIADVDERNNLFMK